MRLINFLKKHFFDEKFDIQHRLLNVIMLAALVGVSISLIIQLFLQNTGVSSPLVAIFMAACLVVFLLILWIANHLLKAQLGAVILSIVLNNILLPSLFFVSGGIKSGMVCWCLGGIILSFLLIKGKKAYIVFACNALAFTTTIVHSFYMPELIIPMGSEKVILFDIASSLIIVSLILSTVYRYSNYLSEKQKQQNFEAMQIAQNATKAKSEFLSRMSHDIRTPMNTIVGFTEIAKKNITDEKKLTNSLDKISLSSNHLLNLMNDILDMSRIESGNIAIEEENCSLKALIENCCQILENDFSEKGIILTKDYSMLDDDIISCDKLRMNQVLLNVLSNAVKYSSPKGKIFITVIQLTGEDDSVVNTEIHIKDEGCGMTEEYKTRLFTPFERDRISLESGIVGTGLGLAITKSLVEKMGGVVEVESEEGKGTEISINIPFAIPTLTELEDEENNSKVKFEGFKVLLVDDNPLHREIEVDVLEDLGFTVDQESEGLEAFKKHIKNNYDIILMDLVMPVMDGYQTTKLIRTLENPDLAKTPIVAITANAYSDDKSQAFNAGMNAYVTKPFNKKKLVEVLKLILKDNR